MRVIIFLLIATSVFAEGNLRPLGGVRVAINAPATLTFSEAAELALENSAELKHSRASQNLAEGVWKWGIRSYFPRFSFSASENDRLQKIGADSFMKNYGVSAEQLVWDGGRISMSRKLEKMELNLSSAELERMASEIAESAISAYRNVLSSREILKIKEAALIVLEEQCRILNEEVLLGLALPVDIATAEINLASARLEIISLQIDLAETERQFAEILGLDSLPVLTEKVDINYSILLPLPTVAETLAKEKNPDLTNARFSIAKRQTELKYVSRSWIPKINLTGNFSLSGQQYPLTRYNWSVGINVDFSSPWFQSRIGASAGWEPPYDNTAMLQSSLTPLPDPASGFGRRKAALALSLEQDRYNILFEQTGRMAANAVEKCRLAENKRRLAVETAHLGNERCRIEEIRLQLGQITRLELMEVLIEQTQKEITVVNAAVSLLEAERELERFLDLKPGELKNLANNFLLGSEI